jgi:hypothetical protein
MSSKALWLSGPPVCYTDSFRTNVNTFLRDYGQRVNIAFLKNVNVYIVKLSNSDTDVNLHVYEEKKVADHCDHCRNIGAWQLLQTRCSILTAVASNVAIAFCRVAAPSSLQQALPLHHPQRRRAQRPVICSSHR